MISLNVEIVFDEKNWHRYRSTVDYSRHNHCHFQCENESVGRTPKNEKKREWNEKLVKLLKRNVFVLHRQTMHFALINQSFPELHFNNPKIQCSMFKVKFHIECICIYKCDQQNHN